ncbi:BnaA10g08280D [Brassica napus]|uniref:(rape) hypothetical protein n=1 Tax=Brassica napus TaxID=3708 RepID=A0A078HX95_BRANA|nr:unnamed protein product [Brassica napus]CDY42452.1 BnaA10g08280D [Brassica napus]
MSLLLSRLSRLCPGKPSLVGRSSYSLLFSNGFSSSLLQTAPGFVKNTESWFTHLEKKVPLETTASYVSKMI